MLRILSIVYSLALVNYLLIVALERSLPGPDAARGVDGQQSGPPGAA